MSSTKIHRSRLVRTLYLVAGFTALILAVAGVVLPVLPTTPFVLLAAACFARSSQRFHDMLLTNRIAGIPVLLVLAHRTEAPSMNKSMLVSDRQSIPDISDTGR